MVCEGTVDIQGLKYTFPKRPPLKDIRNYGLPRKLQVWSRNTEYEQWSWNTDPEEGELWYDNPEEGQMEWYKDEIHRINNGEWIYIDNEPTYLNKYDYFYHQWHTHQGGYYSQYRDTSTEFFRFYEIVDKSPYWLGLIGIKGRRLGMSSMAASIHLLHALTEENNLQGIVSKTSTDAKEMYLMIKYSLESLPSFLMPDMRSVGEKEMHFATPRERVSKNNQKINTNKGLNNRINWLAPSENAYDGRELRFLVIDEAAKFEECDVRKLFSKVSETLATGASVVGKVLMFSTVNAPSKGGLEFEEIWHQSDHTDERLLDPDGITPTRMARFYIEGYKGVQGFIDRYGKSVIDTPTPDQSEYMAAQVHPKTGRPLNTNTSIGSLEFRKSRRKQLESNPELLSEEKRKFPFTWQEAFDSANNSCLFNIDDIKDREEELKNRLVELGRDIEKDELGRRGWFHKLDTGRVAFIDDPKGLWFVDTLLPDAESNKFTLIGDKRVPTNEEFGAAGLDPIRAGDSTVDPGSDACLIIRSRYSSLNPDGSGKPVAMFLGRMDNSKKFHEQIYNGLQYYGVKMLSERSPLNWLDYAEDNGLLGYLYSTTRSNGTKVYGIVNQHNDATKQEHIDVQILASLSDHSKIPFIRLIRDRKNFDIKNRTKYDACMADGYALMALKEPLKQKKKSRTKGRKFIQKGKIFRR